MSEIKEQMKEIQKEAYLIESEMEGKFQSMMLKNEVKKKMLPESLTSEMETEADKQARILNKEIKNSKPNYNKTRDLITERLGGPFDYN